MAKLIVAMLIVLQAVTAGVYEKKCVPCHSRLPVSLEKLFFNYLLVYSSERQVKQALRLFLRNPTKKRSTASEELLESAGLMPPSKLAERDLERAVNHYWELYKVFGKVQ